VSAPLESHCRGGCAMSSSSVSVIGNSLHLRFTRLKRFGNSSLVATGALHSHGAIHGAFPQAEVLHIRILHDSLCSCLL
jgi:hypothetical protein